MVGKILSKFKIALLIFLGITLIGFLLPQRFTMPVDGASRGDYNQQSFWYYPWGKSGTHKGVDIFASAGKAVNSSTDGIVIYCGQVARGGNIVLVLGAKWRLHYYAHLQKIETHKLSFVKPSEKIGTVGNSGNAAGKPAHLHYSIFTPFPYLWNLENCPQAYRKVFYINPVPLLNGCS